MKSAYDSAVSWISTNGTNVLNHLSNTSNPHSVTKAQVGLGNVDNTTDASKPVSTATQTALNLKANIAAPTFTGIPAAPTAAADTNTTQLATTAFVNAERTNTATLTNKTLISPYIDVGEDEVGDVYYRNDRGEFMRLPIGTDGQVLAVEGGIPLWSEPSGGGGSVGTYLFTTQRTSTRVTQSINPTTTAYLAYINIPAGITINKIIFSGASFSSGVIKM